MRDGGSFATVRGFQAQVSGASPCTDGFTNTNRTRKTTSCVRSLRAAVSPSVAAAFPADQASEAHRVLGRRNSSRCVITFEMANLSARDAGLRLRTTMVHHILFRSFVAARADSMWIATGRHSTKVTNIAKNSGVSIGVQPRATEWVRWQLAPPLFDGAPTAVLEMFDAKYQWYPGLGPDPRCWRSDLHPNRPTSLDDGIFNAKRVDTLCDQGPARRPTDICLGRTVALCSCGAPGSSLPLCDE